MRLYEQIFLYVYEATEEKFCYSKITRMKKKVVNFLN